MSIERTRAPEWLKQVNQELMDQQEAGTGMADLTVLTVRGRRSGAARRTPVSVMHLDDARFLMCGFPGADWPANVRAARGEAVLSVGKTQEEVTLVELGPEESVPVLRAWPGLFADGVAIMLDAGVVTDTSADTFAALAGHCPVFLVAPR